jgi:hypothetical protein
MVKPKMSGDAGGGGHDDNTGPMEVNWVSWGAVSRTPQCAHAITLRALQGPDLQCPFGRDGDGHVVVCEMSLHSTCNVLNLCGLSA